MIYYPQMQKNFRHLYADIFWYGVLSGSTIAFMAIYATRLGANGLQIGLLTAGPAVVNMLFSLPAGHWLENLPLTGASFWSAAGMRIGYLLLMVLPWLFGASGQVIAMILIILLMSFPGTLFAISYNAVLAEIVPVDRRAEVVGKRNALLAISMTLSTLVSGFLLDQIAFPINYQVVFGLGALGAGLSAYHISRLQAPSRKESHEPSLAGQVRFKNLLGLLERLPLGGGTALRSLVRLDMLRGRFGLFMAAYLIFYIFQYISVPLFPLAYVNSLQLSDWTIGLGSGLFYGTMFVVSLKLKDLSIRFGHHRLLAASAVAFSSYPILIGLAKGPFLFWAACFFGGIVYGVITASLINRLMEVVPDQDRAAGMAFHNLVLNLGILAGSLGGPLVGDWLGVQEGLLFTAGLRLLAGVLMIFWA